MQNTARESDIARLRRDEKAQKKKKIATPDIFAFEEDENSSDEEDWEVVQETHCHLELPECPVKLTDAKKIRVVGLDTKEPYIQVNNIFFRGSYTKTMGTTVFFDGNSKTQNMVGQEIGKTERKLLMKEVHLMKKRNAKHEPEAKERRGRFRTNDSPPSFLEKEQSASLSSSQVVQISGSESDSDSEDSLIEIEDTDGENEE